MCGETLRIETLSLTDLEAAASLWSAFLEERRVQETRRPRMQHLLGAAQAALQAYEAALNGESDPQDPVARALRQTVQQRQQELHKLESHVATQAGSLNALLQKAVKGNGMLTTMLEMPAVESLPEWLAGLGIRDADTSTIVVPDWVAGLGPTDDAPPIIEADANKPKPATDLGDDLMSSDDALAWLQSLTVGKEDEIRAQAEADAEARVAEILGRKPAAPVIEAEPDPVPEPDAAPDEDEAAPVIEAEATPGDADFAALFDAAPDEDEAAPVIEAEPDPVPEPDAAPDEDEAAPVIEADPWLAILGGGGDPF